MAEPAAGLRPLDGWATLIILVCCACWGMNQVAIKIASAGIPPMLQAGVRSLLSGSLVLIWAWFRNIPLFERDGSLRAGLAVGIAFAVNFMMVYPGLQYTTASRAVLFIYSMPFFVAIGAHYLIPGDRITPTKAAGLLASFAGLAVAVGDGLSGKSEGSLLGDLLCLGSAIGWAITTILMRTTTLRAVVPEKVLLYQLGFSAPLLLIVSAAIGEAIPPFPEPQIVAAFAYTVVIVAFITYITWVWLLSRHPPSAVSSFVFLAPIFGVLAGALFLGETVNIQTWISLALVAFGIALINKPVRVDPTKP
ncbi:DMT family transporter [Leptospira interrogans]